LAETVAAIGENGVEPVAQAFFANLLFHLLDAAKLDARCALGVVRWHACANVFRY